MFIIQFVFVCGIPLYRQTVITVSGSFAKRLEHAVNGVLSALKSRNDILRRRLQQCNQFGDEFVLGLDSAQELEILLAYVNSLFHVSSFELRLSLSGLVTLGKLFDEFGRSVTGVAEHESGVTLQCLEDICLNALFLKSFVEQCVLGYQEFDILFEASTAQVACFRSIQTLDVHEVEMRELAQLGA